MGKRVNGVKSKLRRNESYKFNLDPSKIKKDNSIKAKVSSNRMTQIVPGFLSYGVKSTFAKKEETEENNKYKNILKENLHSLFSNSDNSSIRRSSRISEKNLKNYSESHSEKINYISKEFPSLKGNKNRPNNSSIKKIKDTTSVSKVLPFCKEKNSKSLFKKIICSQTFVDSSSFFKSLFSFKNQEVGNDFNHNLLNKIQINLKINVIQELQNKIFDEIAKVNDVLTGQTEVTHTMGSFKKLTHEIGDPEYEVPKFFFSSQEWQYATPPSQKFNMTLYEESAIQPAILYNNEIGRNIYELKKDINSNFINYINPDNVEVDKRYMEQIAEFDKENRPLREFSWHEDRRKNEKSDKVVSQFNFKPANMNPYLIEHLNTIHARPKKTVKRLRYAEAFSGNEIDITQKRYCRPSTSTVSSDTSNLLLINCMSDISSVESPHRNSSLFNKVTPRRRPLFNHLNTSQDE